MSDDAEVVIGADTGKAEGALQHLADVAKESLGRLGDSLNGVSSISVGLGMAMEKMAEQVIEKLKEVVEQSVEAFAKLGDQIEHLHLVIGGMPEDLSRLTVVLGAIGMSTSAYEGIAFRLSRQLASGTDAFDKYKVATKDAEGHLLSTPQIIQNVVDKLNEYEAGTNRNKVGTELMGRGFRSMTDLMKLNKDIIEESNAVAAQFGQTLGETDVENAHKFEVATNLLGIAMKGFYVEVGKAVDPFLTDLANLMRDVLAPVFLVFQGILHADMTVVYGFAMGVDLAYNVLMSMGDVIALVIKLLPALGEAMLRNGSKAYDIAKKSWEEYTASVAARAEATIAYAEKVNAALAHMWAPHPEPEKKGKEAPDDKGGEPDVSGWMKAQEAALAMRKTNYALSNDLRKIDLGWESEYWAAAAALVKGQSEAENQLRADMMKKSSELRLKAAEEERKIQDGLWKEQNGALKKTGGDRIALEEQEAKNLLDAGVLKQQQYLQMELQFAKKRYDLQLVDFTSQQEMLKASGKDERVALAKLNDDKLSAQRKYQLDVSKINGDIAKDSKKEWEQLLAPITSALDSSIKGIIAGTTTLSKAFKNLGIAILSEFANLGVKRVASEIATQLGLTSAAKAGETARGAIQQEGVLAGLAASSAGIIKTIMGYAQQAFAGVWAALSGIPFIGPALAAAEAPVALGAVMAVAGSVPSSAGGDWQIPSDRLNFVHKDETILPAEKSKGLDNLISGGSGGGNHYHVHAADTNHMMDLLKNNGHQLVKILQGQQRNFAGAGR